MFDDMFVGQMATVRFNNGHPEVTGIIEYISEEHISIGEKRFFTRDVQYIGVDFKRCEICGSLTDKHYNELCFK
jgi:hypothetical protein